MSYAAVVETVSAYLASIPATRPVRVAVDGRTACGKSTFARALVAQLAERGRSTLHTTIDGFHNPRSVRYARGRLSAEGYYRDARDLPAVRRELLDPLGPGGSRHIRTEIFDLAADAALNRPPVQVSGDIVLIVDGTFLGRPELSDAWDVHLFLRTSRDMARARGLSRDERAGSETDQVKSSYDLRYLPAFDLYLSEANPESEADILIDLEDFSSPRIIRMPT
ncbi:uridylate kinase [Hyphomonas sp.]|uniref:uridylate kinase n=1 Tax=Hyphomonas sp. TaxID=87 RepID=UPI00391D4903